MHISAASTGSRIGSTDPHGLLTRGASETEHVPTELFAFRTTRLPAPGYLPNRTHRPSAASAHRGELGRSLNARQPRRRRTRRSYRAGSKPAGQEPATSATAAGLALQNVTDLDERPTARSCRVEDVQREHPDRCAGRVASHEERRRPQPSRSSDRDCAAKVSAIAAATTPTIKTVEGRRASAVRPHARQAHTAYGTTTNTAPTSPGT